MQPLLKPYPPEPPGSEDRYKLKLQRSSRAPDGHPTPGAISWSVRLIAFLVALVFALLALLFTAVGMLTLVSDGCEYYGIGESPGGSCEPMSFPSRIPLALPWMVVAVIFWAFSAVLIRQLKMQPRATGRLARLVAGLVAFVLAFLFAAVGISVLFNIPGLGWLGPGLTLVAVLFFSAGGVALVRPLRTRDVDYGWRPDPSGRFEKRYYGPKGWTDHVANISEKLQTRDPIPVGPKLNRLWPDDSPYPRRPSELQGPPESGSSDDSLYPRRPSRDRIPVGPKTGETPSDR